MSDNTINQLSRATRPKKTVKAPRRAQIKAQPISLRDLTSGDADLPTTAGQYLTVICDFRGKGAHWWITNWNGMRWELSNHIVVSWKPLDTIE